MTAEEATFKARLAALQEAGGLDRFRRAAIAQVYRDALAAAVPAPGDPRPEGR